MSIDFLTFWMNCSCGIVFISDAIHALDGSRPRENARYTDVRCFRQVDSVVIVHSM